MENAYATMPPKPMALAQLIADLSRPRGSSRASCSPARQTPHVAAAGASRAAAVHHPQGMATLRDLCSFFLLLAATALASARTAPATTALALLLCRRSPDLKKMNLPAAECSRSPDLMKMNLPT